MTGTRSAVRSADQSRRADVPLWSRELATPDASHIGISTSRGS